MRNKTNSANTLNWKRDLSLVVGVVTASFILGCAGDSDTPISFEDSRDAQSDSRQTGADSSDLDGRIADDEMSDSQTIDGSTTTEQTIDLGAPNSQNMTTECAESDGDLDGFGTHDSCEVIDCDDGNPSISPASFEACNGLDDDCDGESDEGLGQRRCGMGECSIRIDNCIAGEISICPEGVGQPESCNGLDDDCDGEVDEEIAQLTCGMGACLAHAMCVDGVQNECRPSLPNEEMCDSLDNDCDGKTDEGFQTRIDQIAVEILNGFHNGCTASNLYSADCNAAMHRYCVDHACGMTGFGPAENANGNAHVTCISGSVPQSVPFSTLWLHHPECGDASDVLTGPCHAAVHRYCRDVAGATTVLDPSSFH